MTEPRRLLRAPVSEPCGATAAAFVVAMHDDLEAVVYIESCAEHVQEVHRVLEGFGFEVGGVFDMAAEAMWLEEAESILGTAPEKLQLAAA